MNKIKYLLLFILLIPFIVKADDTCSDTELKRLKELANRVSVNYEVREEESYTPDLPGKTIYVNVIYLTINNLDNALSLEISNNQNDNILKVNNQNFNNNKYSFSTSDNYGKITKYTFKIVLPNCNNYLIKTLTFVKPRVNLLHYNNVCKGNEELEICQEYISKDYDIDYSNIENYINNYKSKITSTSILTTSINNKLFLNNNKYIFFGVSCLIIIIITIVVIKKRGKI